MSERIAAAAISEDGIVYSLEPPARHHTIMKYCYDNGKQFGPTHIQGFITDTGRFVERKEACAIARDAGQIIEKTGPQDTLFSEDLW